MHPFQIQRSCSKCGFYAKIPGIEYKTGIFNILNQEEITNTTIGDTRPDEYLLRRCLRCGYKWPERTVDSWDADKI